MSGDTIHQERISCQLTDQGEHAGEQSGPVSLKEIQILPVADRCVLTVQMLGLNWECEICVWQASEEHSIPGAAVESMATSPSTYYKVKNK